jgi:hypothetical protein
MNISPSDAETALAAIRESEAHMRKTLNASSGAYQLIAWGMIMMIGYTMNQFAEHIPLALVVGIWVTLSVLGNILSIALGIRMARKFHSPDGARIGAMLPIFILFGIAAAFFIHPDGPREINLLIYLLVMLWLAMMGLWVKLSLLWISLAFSILMLFGYAVLPDYFFLWLGIVGGGSMIGCGLLLLRGRG